MSQTKKGWDRNLALSLFKKEGSYDAGVTMSDAYACSLTGFEADVTWDDKIVSDKEDVGKLPTVVGSNLVASWANTAHPTDYDTFTSVGSPDIASAILTGATTGVANSAAITLTTYKRYKITPGLTLNSGTSPVLTGTGGVPTTTLAAGMAPIEFIATGATTTLTITTTGATNWACTFTLYELAPYELGNDQELITYGAKFTIKQAKAKPNALAGLASLVFGSTTPSQDPGKTAYVHKIIPVTVGTALPSCQLEEFFGDLHYKYTGVKGNTLKISGEAGGVVSLEAQLIGSGTRATSSTAFPAAISESWMHLHDCKVWLESGANISITSGAMVQAAEDISSDTPDNLSARMKSFEFTWDNKLEGQEGFGGGGVFVDADYGRRVATFKMTIIFYDGTELAYYTAQNPVAIELDLKGALIASGGTMYFGASLVIPRMKMKPAPLPKGGPNDTLIQDFEFDIYDDGTNSAARLDVYTAQAAYLAA